MEIEPNADLRVLDRAFLHGDIVARASDALGQQGVVVAVHVDVDLQFADRTRVRACLPSASRKFAIFEPGIRRPRIVGRPHRGRPR